MRRWLQLGVASAGMGAALLGFSLVGPDPASATADTGADSSASSGSAKPNGPGGSRPSRANTDGSAGADGADSGETAAGTNATDAGHTDAGDTDANGTDAADSDAADTGTADSDAADEAADAAALDDLDDLDDPDTRDIDVEDTETAEDVVPPAAAPSDTEAASNVSLVAGISDAAGTVEVTDDEPPTRPWNDVVAEFLDDWTARTVAWIDTLQVSDQRKLRMEESFYAMRRAFFNQAPTVDPVQITGVITGPITGAIYAEDADDDRIVYRIVQGPKTGSLRFHADGTYTYTPGADFNGVDTFTVIAIDAGLHLNLLNLFRPLGTQATSLINQGAIRFDFNYNDPGEHWGDAERDALVQATNQLIWYFRVAKPVVLTYDVTAENTGVGALAWAHAGLMPGENAFVLTQIQHEMISGDDPNDDATDGEIHVNFGYKWGLDGDLARDEYDFVGVLMHEILHSFGFSVEGGPNNTRTLYSSFIMTRDEDTVYNADTTWNNYYDAFRTGWYGGLYFGGANAVQEYGRLVPLFTPSDFRPGSTLHHLDDYTFRGDDYKLMNAQRPPGLKMWTVSDLELAIFEDLGYTVASLPKDVDDEDDSTDPLDVWTEDTIAMIDGLQVSAQTKLSLEQSFFAMRRALFNRAPVVDPVQLTGVITGAITGQLNADDVDDDRVVFRILKGPDTGSLRLHADGSYTYTPNEDFDGVDSFTVIALDKGLHVNLVDPLRPFGTRATPLINQGAIKFDFNFKNDPDRAIWTDERVAALQQAADQLVWYFRVPKPVILTYDVVVSNDPKSDTLASASGELMPELTGFVRTRLQHEIITGEDTNGSEADGFIDVNFGHNWSLGPDVGPRQSDFVGVMMHELLHSWGWGNLSAAGLRRAIYSSYLMTTDRDRVFNDDTTWNPAYNLNAIGQNGGLFFGGTNAVAEYGGLVPVYTPSSFAGGSSIHHLDDETFTSDDYKLMNALRPPGLKWWIVSDLEIAILKDLGYNAVPLPEED